MNKQLRSNKKKKIKVNEIKNYPFIFILGKNQKYCIETNRKTFLKDKIQLFV